MAENKTKYTDASVEDYITSRANAQQRFDCRELIALSVMAPSGTPTRVDEPGNLLWQPLPSGAGSWWSTWMLKKLQERRRDRCSPGLASTGCATLVCTSSSLPILISRPSKSLSSVRSQRQSGAMDKTSAIGKPLHTAVRMFVVFCVAMAVVGLISFWPPRTSGVVAWLLVWTGICLSTAITIVRRASYAPLLVWSLLALAGYSAVSAFRSGMLSGIGIVIDIVLFVPLIWFALWYQRHRRIN
jgi:hypothetical protein